MSEKDNEGKMARAARLFGSSMVNRGFLKIPSLSSVKTAGDQEQLIELFVRLMYRVYPIMSGGGDVYVTAGEAPDYLLAKVPMPEGSRIIGSTRTSEGCTVVYETKLSRERVKAFYDENLKETDWSKPENPMGMGMRQGGFDYQYMEQLEERMGQTYCGGEDGPVLTIAIHNQGGESMTDVVLNWYTHTQGTICDKRQQRQYRQHRMMMPESMLPRLSAPQGDIQIPGNSGRSIDHEASQARLISDRSLEEIASHYQAQIEGAGWKRTENKVEESSVLSAYEFRDEEGDKWSAFFAVLARPDQEDSYLVLIEADEENNGRERSFGGGGGIVFSS